MIEQYMEFVTEIRIKYIILYIEDKFKKYRKSISVFFKFHKERIFVNDLIDDREYGFIKLAYRDCLGDILYKEIPVFIKDCVEDILCRVDIKIEEMMDVLNKKKEKVSRKEWHNQIVIFSQQATGYFIHEVIGHLLEEDVYVYSKEYLHKIISPKVTVIDDIMNYGNMIGLNTIDDEGVMLKPVTLVQNGKIRNILSLGENINGVARRMDYTKKALPRMRCTFLKPVAKMTKNDFIKAFDDVIVVDNIYSGVSSYIDGQFSIAGNGMYLKNGMEIYYINNLIISSFIEDYLKNIIEIGNDLSIYATECSKMGHTIRVGIGGPCVCFENVNVLGDCYRYGKEFF